MECGPDFALESISFEPSTVESTCETLSDRVLRVCDEWLPCESKSMRWKVARLRTLKQLLTAPRHQSQACGTVMEKPEADLQGQSWSDAASLRTTTLARLGCFKESGHDCRSSLS